MALQHETIKPEIGSRVLSPKEDLLSGEYAKEVRDLLEERGVLVFPKIDFDDDEQIAFTKTLGTLYPEHNGEELHKITLDPVKTPSADYLKGSMYWHLDGTMNDKPIFASLLSGKVLSDVGGETHFSNTYAAYENLSDEDKAKYEEMCVMHGAWASLYYYDPEPNPQMLNAMMNIGDARLPLVWKHRSGRKSLVLGCTAYEVEGLGIKESRKILTELLAWSTQEAFVYEHKWSVGDMVIWDNTGTLHRATPYDPRSGRCMHRTKLEGDEAFAFAN